MKKNWKKPTVEAVIDTCTWCGKPIPPDHERFSINCQKRPGMDISQYEGNIMAVRLTMGKTVWALVPTADSDAKRAGHDFMFLVCSDACGVELSDVLRHEKGIGDLLFSAHDN